MMNAKRESTTSLPERWKQNRRRAAVVSLAIVLLISGLVEGSSSAEYANQWWLSAHFVMRESLADRWSNWRGQKLKPDNRIAIVEIDDKSLAYEKWKNDPLIAWGGYIAQTINQLNRSGARLIALDWTQPIETDARMKWNHDAQLGQALSESRGVVFAKFVKPDGSYVLPTPSLLFAAPGAIEDNGESSLGYAEAGGYMETGRNEAETVWTSVQPVIQDGQKREVSFAARIAERSGWIKVEELPAKPLLINFSNRAGERGPHAPFQWASLCDVATTKKPDARWKDKIVLIGATYKGWHDYHHIPFLMGFAGKRQISGVEVQAHALKTLLDRNEIGQLSRLYIWLLSALIGGWGVLSYAVWNWGRATIAAIALALVWTILGVIIFIAANFSLPFVVPLFSLLSGGALMGGYRALSEERERAQVMKVWGRQQDPRLINELLANPDLRGGQGREMTVTVLFADLKNFTKTVEMLPPNQAIAALNRYLSLIAEVVLKHGGVVDKYLGDGLMAQWGAPLPDEQHALLAVRACLDMQSRINALTEQLRAQDEVWFEARLTLHSGPVLVGAVGAEQRLEFTIIGDTVNVTSRLQETAKAMGCDFLISETTCDLLDETIKQQVIFGRTDEVEIRGRQQPLEVFEVLSEQSKWEGL
jgi:adenylate cyclase